MKKILFVVSLIFLLAAGCSNSTPGYTASNGSSGVLGGQAPANNGNSEPISANNNAPASCEQIIPLTQLKSIVGDSDMSLGVSNGDNAAGSKDHLATCIYENYDIQNPTNIKSRIIGVNFTVFYYSDLAWQSSLGSITNSTNFSGLGSKALRYIYNTNSNSPAYIIVSSNGKYIFNISENDVTNTPSANAGHLSSTKEDTAKEDQLEVSISKAIDANLGKY